MENIDLLSSVLKLEVGGNCWRQQQLHSAWVRILNPGLQLLAASANAECLGENS